jgi:hypothetical protein
MTPLIIHVDFRAIGRKHLRSASIDRRRKDTGECRAGAGQPGATALIIQFQAARKSVLAAPRDPGGGTCP